MIRRSIAILTVLLLVLSTLPAQDRPQRGTVKAFDSKANTVTITADGKDIVCRITDATRVVGEAEGAKLKDGDLKPGMAVMFLTGERDGKTVLAAIRFGGQPAFAKPDTSALKTLMELGNDKYKGYEGGLYPGGKNERPAAHEAAGLALAKLVRPLDVDGKPNDAGKIVLLSVGMSNATQVFSAFKRQADADKDKNPSLTIVDGAQGGMTAVVIKDDTAGRGKQYWDTTDQRLKQAGATPAQVQAAWIKEADAGPSSGFPKYAETLRDELRQIVQLLHKRYPNLKLVYLSCRTYGGYATTRLNPDPYAYESGFSVKWLVEEQIKGEKALNFDPKKGEVAAPWLSWGPYLWANGTKKNPDGLFYEESDYGGDGTHPSQSGQRKVGERLLAFFKSDTTTKPWFVKGP